MRQIARLHIRALPQTWSSRRGERFVEYLYKSVQRVGYVKWIKREGKTVGAVSGVGQLILTLVVSPEWQRRGVGREIIRGLPGRRYVYTEEASRGFYEKMGFSKIIQMGKIIFLCRKS